MAANLSQTPLHESGRISTEEESDLLYWTEALGVTRHALINAIEQVGDSTHAVRTFLTTGNRPKTGTP